ncbi:MAG: hypothetical protein LC785_11900 [Acidobacteria bacterium]|nr:hypothetical protein [Acidobacteriota bacterium]
MRLAYFSPLSPQPSAVSDYSEALLPHLSAGAEIDLFVDGFAPSCRDVRERFRILDYRADPALLGTLGDYHAVVYHVGDDHRYHAGIYAAARAFPGVVVLHDFSLQAFFLGLARERGDADIYLDEVGACHGARARARAARALDSGSVPSLYARAAEFPLNCRLVREAEGVIVHTEWGRESLARIAPATPCALIDTRAAPAAGKAAAGYLAFLREVAAQRERRRFVRGVADELARCGFRESDDALLRGVAAELARVAPARFSGGKREAGEQ